MTAAGRRRFWSAGGSPPGPAADLCGVCAPPFGRCISTRRRVSLQRVISSSSYYLALDRLCRVMPGHARPSRIPRTSRSRHFDSPSKNGENNETNVPLALQIHARGNCETRRGLGFPINIPGWHATELWPAQRLVVRSRARNEPGVPLCPIPSTPRGSPIRASSARCPRAGPVRSLDDGAAVRDLEGLAKILLDAYNGHDAACSSLWAHTWSTIAGAGPGSLIRLNRGLALKARAIAHISARHGDLPHSGASSDSGNARNIRSRLRAARPAPVCVGPELEFFP